MKITWKPTRVGKLWDGAIEVEVEFRVGTAGAPTFTRTFRVRSVRDLEQIAYKNALDFVREGGPAVVDALLAEILAHPGRAEVIE